MVDKDHVYTSEELRCIIESYLMQNSLWNESNKQSIFLLKDIKEDSEYDATILTFINGQQFRLSVKDLQSENELDTIR